ncbi:MAG: DUF3800 domain-containing protein [Flavisolibacter sp.]
MTDSFIAFIDESGGHGFDFKKEGTSTHFVITAILVEDGNFKKLEEEFLNIKLKFFPASELKSSRIGNKDNVRNKILDEITALDFKYFLLVVDKRKIHVNTGLQYKESFYKFLYGLLYNNIYRTFKNIEIIADEIISNDFVSSFEKYIKDNHQVDLFHQSKIEFKKSHNTILLQLADFIGGTCNRHFSGKSSVNPLEDLGDKCTAVIIWPEKYHSFTVDEEDELDEFQETISNLALLRIDDYINKNITSRDNIIRLRVMFLSYLKSIFLYNSKTRSIYTLEVLNHLRNNTTEEVDEQFVRRQIVGPLRSEGVLIVSNTTGYKIPSSKKDVIIFFNLFSRTISPMLTRLKKSHEALYQATNGKLNMLDYAEFNYLKKLFD